MRREGRFPCVDEQRRSRPTAGPTNAPRLLDARPLLLLPHPRRHGAAGTPAGSAPESPASPLKFYGDFLMAQPPQALVAQALADLRLLQFSPAAPEDWAFERRARAAAAGHPPTSPASQRAHGQRGRRLLLRSVGTAPFHAPTARTGSRSFFASPGSAASGHAPFSGSVDRVFSVWRSDYADYRRACRRAPPGQAGELLGGVSAVRASEESETEGGPSSSAAQVDGERAGHHLRNAGDGATDAEAGGERRRRPRAPRDDPGPAGAGGSRSSRACARRVLRRCSQSSCRHQSPPLTSLPLFHCGPLPGGTQVAQLQAEVVQANEVGGATTLGAPSDDSAGARGVAVAAIVLSAVSMLVASVGFAAAWHVFSAQRRAATESAAAAAGGGAGGTLNPLEQGGKGSQNHCLLFW